MILPMMPNYKISRHRHYLLCRDHMQPEDTLAKLARVIRQLVRGLLDALGLGCVVIPDADIPPATEVDTDAKIL